MFLKLIRKFEVGFESSRDGTFDTNQRRTNIGVINQEENKQLSINHKMEKQRLVTFVPVTNKNVAKKSQLNFGNRLHYHFVMVRN